MSYCYRHNTTNCVECALEKQTQEIVRAINNLKQPPSILAKIANAIKKFFFRG